MAAIAFIVFYSLTAHVAISLGHPEIPLALLVVGAGTLSARAALRGGRWWPAALAAAAGLLLLASGAARGAVYSTPIIINLLFLWLFARTLRPGETPLVTRIALFMGDAASPELLKYSRRVTQAWCVFFAAMAAIGALLAATAPPWLWSSFAHGINYALLGLFFVIEYAIRIRSLPSTDRGSFFAFLRALSRIDMRAIQRSAGP